MGTITHAYASHMPPLLLSPQATRLNQPLDARFSPTACDGGRRSRCTLHCAASSSPVRCWQRAVRCCCSSRWHCSDSQTASLGNKNPGASKQRAPSQSGPRGCGRATASRRPSRCEGCRHWMSSSVPNTLTNRLPYSWFVRAGKHKEHVGRVVDGVVAATCSESTYLSTDVHKPVTGICSLCSHNLISAPDPDR